MLLISLRYQTYLFGICAGLLYYKSTGIMDGWMLERCPLAVYGCKHYEIRVQPKGGKHQVQETERNRERETKREKDRERERQR